MCAPLQMPARRLIIFQHSMAATYSTTQPKLTPHSQEMGPCLNTFSLMTGMQPSSSSVPSVARALR